MDDKKPVYCFACSFQASTLTSMPDKPVYHAPPICVLTEDQTRRLIQFKRDWEAQYYGIGVSSNRSG